MLPTENIQYPTFSIKAKFCSLHPKDPNQTCHRANQENRCELDTPGQVGANLPILRIELRWDARGGQPKDFPYMTHSNKRGP